MLPLQLNKTRAAAARNLYGLAPEQLLAYASYIPRLPAYGPPPAPTHHHHHHGMAVALNAAAAAGAYHHPQHGSGATCADLPQGVDLLRIAPAATAIPFHGNGFAQHHPQQQQGTITSHFTLGGHSGGSNTGNRGGGQMGSVTGGPINPRDLAAVQLVAQQQAVYEAAMVRIYFNNIMPEVLTNSNSSEKLRSIQFLNKNDLSSNLNLQVIPAYLFTICIISLLSYTYIKTHSRFGISKK